jgi:hypothetical protein
MDIHTESRGQTTTDFFIASVLFVSFISATFFIPGSPLVANTGDTTTTQSAAERALVQAEHTLLTDTTGTYDQAAIKAAQSTDPNQELTVESATVGIRITALTPEAKPSVFPADANTIQIGPSPPSVGVQNASTTATLDRRPIRVTTMVWREE